MAELFGVSKLFVGMTATLINGYSSGIFHLLYRIVPDDNQFFAQLEHYSHYLKIAGFILLAVAIIFIIHKVKKNKKKNKKKKAQDNNT